MWFFGQNLPIKGSYFQSKTGKIDRHHHWILHIELVFASNLTLNGLCIKFYFEHTILNFWTKLTQERYLCSKTGKVNIIKFRIFKLVSVPSFGLNWQFPLFWLDLPKKRFSGLKQKKLTPHIFYIILYIQISLVRNFSSNWQFWFFGSNLPKNAFYVVNVNSSVVFKQFEDLKDLKGKIGYVLPPGLFLSWHCVKLFKQHCANSLMLSKVMIKFRSKFQFQIPLQFYSTV